jgi:DNA-binding GntR family transcriptional regulator
MQLMEPVTSERFVDLVHEKLRLAILSGELTPGTQLSVPELARRLGTSRSPVREAVQQLVSDGLARSTPRKGAVVADLSPRDQYEIHCAREVLEGLACRLAAQNISEAALQQLDCTIREHLRACDAENVEKYVATGMQFHEMIRDASGNRVVSSILRSLHDQLRTTVERASSIDGNMRLASQEHAAIFDAIRHRKASEAERRMRQHIARTRDLVDGRD